MLSKNGSLSLKLSKLVNKQIKITELTNEKAVANDLVFNIYQLQKSDYYNRLNKAIRKASFSRQFPEILGCYALLELKNNNFDDFFEGRPLIFEEQPSGMQFTSIISNFADAEKFSHSLKEDLLMPILKLNKLHEAKPMEYIPFVDNFALEFFALLTRLETNDNLHDISESRSALAKWLPLIRRQDLSAIHGNLISDNIYKTKNGYRLFKHSAFMYGDKKLDVAALVFSLIKASYSNFNRMQEPYITAISLILQAYNEKDLGRALVPYIAYFSFNESKKKDSGCFMKLARNILHEEEFDVNELDYLMELDFEVEKHEAES